MNKSIHPFLIDLVFKDMIEYSRELGQPMSLLNNVNITQMNHR